jgi:putrescine transport system substrate-binding protein
MWRGSNIQGGTCLVVLGCIFAGVIALFSFHHGGQKDYGNNVVHICGWYGIISRSILREFEETTGIHVVYDVFDNNDTLEAKLLATNSGYDIVFPSFIPYASRQCSIGVYAKLDKLKLQNFQSLQTPVTEKFKEAGGDTDYLIPIFWGTTGIAYNHTLLSELGEETVSYDTLLNPDKLSKLARYGVSFPEEFVDIFPQAKKFWAIPGEMNDVGTIPMYKKKFLSIRKYIKKFTSSTMISDILAGDFCAAIGSSDNAWRLKRAAEATGMDVRYVIPHGFGVLWIDCVCIPNKALHKDNAHKFIDFLLLPRIAAQITNESGILTNVTGACDLYASEITVDQNICPPEKSVANLMMGRASTSKSNLAYHKHAAKAWSQIRMGNFQDG